MSDIVIKKESKHKDGWEFIVDIFDNKSKTEHKVFLDYDFYDKIISGMNVEPGNVIVESFKFLLAREAKENILLEFNTKSISHYFPEYEGEIKNILMKKIDS